MFFKRIGLLAFHFVETILKRMHGSPEKCELKIPIWNKENQNSFRILDPFVQSKQWCIVCIEEIIQLKYLVGPAHFLKAWLLNYPKLVGSSKDNGVGVLAVAYDHSCGTPC